MSIYSLSLGMKADDDYDENMSPTVPFQFEVSNKLLNILPLNFF